MEQYQYVQPWVHVRNDQGVGVLRPGNRGIRGEKAQLDPQGPGPAVQLRVRLPGVQPQQKMKPRTLLEEGNASGKGAGAERLQHGGTPLSVFFAHP